MKSTNKIIVSFIVITTLLIAIFYFYNVSSNFIIKTSKGDLIISDKKWKKFIDSEIYAKNFESRENIAGELYPQVITVYLNKMTSDRMTGVKISDSEYLEIFTLNPKTVTIQIRNDKNTYWVLSRQTFPAENKEIADINPELSKQNFLLYQNFFQNEIDATRYVINYEF